MLFRSEVVTPYNQCCGALALHAGQREDGHDAAARTHEAFKAAGVDFIVTNAAGCGSHLKDAHLDIPVRDVSELLAVGNAPELHPLPYRVAFQESCHLGHVIR